MAINAATTVFSITELVEAILVFLDTKDIVKAIRLSRNIKEVIFQSKAFKQKLFLEPLPSGLIDPFPVGEHHLTVNLTSSLPREYDEYDALSDPNILIAINPILHGFRAKPEPSYSLDVSNEIPCFLVRSCIDPSRVPGILRHGGSKWWEEMFLCQPPPTEATLAYHIGCNRVDKIGGKPMLQERYHRVRYSDGVRLRHVVDKIQAELAMEEEEDGTTHAWVPGWKIGVEVLNPAYEGLESHGTIGSLGW